VAEVLVENYPVPMKRIGIRDHWVDSGEIEELFQYYQMQPEDIARAAVESIKLKESRL
jgi:transketolase